MDPIFFAGWGPLLRLVAVGVPLYLVVLALLLVAGKQSLARKNAYGMVATVSLGSVLATSVLDKQITLVDSIAALGLLIGLQYLFSIIATRWAWAGNFLTHQPALLVKDGRLLPEMLKQERITEADVFAAVRSRGLGCLEDVAAVVLETDGTFSVVTKPGSASALKGIMSEPHQE